MLPFVSTAHLPSMDPKELEVLRLMPPEAKLAVMKSLIRQAYQLKAAGLRALHPELSEAELEARVRSLVGHYRS